MSMFPPFQHLTAEQVNIIREQSDIAETLGKLNSEQLLLAYKEQWFSMLVPACYGGQELPLPQVVQLEEELARADGSLGWAVTLCAGAGWFGGFTHPEFSKEIFNNKKVCLAGSGAPSGIANTVPGGYIVTGKWMHASGAQHATVFTANCVICEDGIPFLDGDGNQKIIAFTFLKNEVKVVPGWPFIGMKATSSHRYEVNNVFIPHTRTFKIDPAAAYVKNVLYRYPFRQLAWATLAANIGGMAMHFMELSFAIFNEKKSRQGVLLMEMDKVKNAFYIHLHQFMKARSAFYDTLNQSWATFAANENTDQAELLAVNTTSYLLAEAARHAVDSLYPYCGLLAADTSSTINRVWRDIHTAGQHALLVFGDDR